MIVILSVLLLVAVGIALRLHLKANGFERRAATLLGEKQTLESRILTLDAELQSLSRFRAVQNAESEAARLRTEGQARFDAAKQQADAILATANLHAQGAVSAADARAGQLTADATQRATATIAAASQNAASIIAIANQEAQSIADNALEAQRNVESYRREAKALENVISGYGDRYLVPVHSVLDDLAESFGFTEAGEALKRARERTRHLILSGEAAACDYVEDNRRDTAIAFVIDAFNGKVDSILSLVKEDNIGTLLQKIRDAYAIVNKGGRAFKNARILDAFLQSREQELRWAAAVIEIKNRQKEEQRRIKEQIREEEKARKEYERAIRDAEKEEDALRKAMEKVQREVAKASDEQRAQYEAKLADLALKLQAAEEKNKRALSMAQQTKTGHVYVISNVGSFGEDVFKIGLTRRLEPLDRVKELGDASVPFEFDVHAMILSEDAPALEHALHRHFLANQLNKVNARKEFFRASLKLIREEIEKLGINSSWTMTAAAAEYRQSLAIEKAIRENPASYTAWMNKQLVLDAQAEVMDEADLAEAS